MPPGFDKRKGLQQGKPPSEKLSSNSKEKKRKEKNKRGRMISACVKELKLREERPKILKDNGSKPNRLRRNKQNVARLNESDKYKKKSREDVNGNKSLKHGPAE